MLKIQPVAQKAYSDTKNSLTRSFHRVKTKVICKYVMLAIANYGISNNIDLIFVHEVQLSTGSLCYNRKMYKYMHGIYEKQSAYHFCFQHKSGVIL